MYSVHTIHNNDRRCVSQKYTQLRGKNIPHESTKGCGYANLDEACYFNSGI